MTVEEMFLKNPGRSWSPPESIFVIEDGKGGEELCCFASMVGPPVREFLKKMGSRKVLKEHMTQKEIDDFTSLGGLWPNPKFTPIRDMVLAMRVKQEKVGSIFLPDNQVEIQKQTCRVLGVGPGMMLDDGVIRPAPCKRGDLIYTTPNDGFRIVINGEEYWVFESMEVVGIFEDEEVVAYGNETC